MSTSSFHHLLKGLVVCFCFSLAVQLKAGNSVAVENTNPGTSLWRLTNPASMSDPLNQTATSYYANAEIQGYASRTSVNQGQSIDFFVRTINTNSYTFSIFRLGWYNGLGGRLMLGPVTLTGVVQPMPAAPVLQPAGTGLVECNWSVSYSLTIPTNWVSGVYVAKLSLSAPAKESWIIFLVRDDSRNSPILYQASFATYQAYNEWGGSSLYTTTGNDANTGPRTGYKVSFNRPFWRDSGAGDFMRYEIGMVRWLEHQGYDLTYATDLDTHENPNLLLSHKVFLAVGHAEYWSWNMRANVDVLSNEDVFFSPNVPIVAEYQIGLAVSQVLHYKPAFRIDNSQKGESAEVHQRPSYEMLTKCTQPITHGPYAVSSPRGTP